MTMLEREASTRGNRHSPRPKDAGCVMRIPRLTREVASYARAVHTRAAKLLASAALGEERTREDGLVVSDSENEGATELVETWGDNMLWARCDDGRGSFSQADSSIHVQLRRTKPFRGLFVFCVLGGCESSQLKLSNPVGTSSQCRGHTWGRYLFAPCRREL